MAQDAASETRLPDLLSATELAAYLGIPVSTVHFWRGKGQGPPALKVGKQLRFRAVDVATWLERQETKGGGD
jgi:excisionase family DNA binding protein